MGSSDADSEATAANRLRSRWTGIAVAIVLVLLGSSVLLRTTSVVDPTVAVGALAILTLLAAALLWRRAGASTAEESGDEGESEDGGSDVWNAIPDWQYGGRHVESGGLARGEQEAALQDIQQQADELEERR